jgi:lipoprotein-anchoring transpeptidase ErfK/SrfK
LRITGTGVFLHDAPWRTAFGPGTNLTQAGGLRTGSHGCINLPFATAQFVWSFAPIGTPVDVVA